MNNLRVSLNKRFQRQATEPIWFFDTGNTVIFVFKATNRKSGIIPFCSLWQCFSRYSLWILVFHYPMWLLKTQIPGLDSNSVNHNPRGRVKKSAFHAAFNLHSSFMIILLIDTGKAIIRCYWQLNHFRIWQGSRCCHCFACRMLTRTFLEH